MVNPYGVAQLNTGLEDWGVRTFRGVTSAAQSSNIIDPSFISSIINDPNTLAFYTNALVYGGYQVGDIINDLKRRELSKGDPNLSKIKIIDPEIKRADYVKSAEGIKAANDVRQFIPTIQLTGNLNPEILKYGINMPDEAFKILSPIYDINSNEFKKAVENVKSAYYDLSIQQLQAESEQEKVVADANMAKFKETLERQYGIALSDNATAAWKQLESLGSEMSQRGLQGSGMEQETIDDYLRAIRNKDAQNRQAKLSSEETQMASYYKASATPEQIKALIAEDQAKGLSKDQWRATKWGLVPSDDILQKYSLENLKQKFPDQSEEELKAYRDAVLDEFGNYRSTLYGNYYSKLNDKMTEKKTAAMAKVWQESLNKDEQMRRNYDMASSFSSMTVKDEEKLKETLPSSSNSVGSGVIEQTDEQRQRAFKDAGVSLPSSNQNKTLAVGEQTDEQRQRAFKDAQMTPEGIKNIYQPKIDEISKSIQNLQKSLQPQSSNPTPQSSVIKTESSAPKKQYSTLYDYYSANGGWNTWNSPRRLADAKAAGISNYTGEEDQNVKLLKYLRGY